MFQKQHKKTAFSSVNATKYIVCKCSGIQYIPNSVKRGKNPRKCKKSRFKVLT